MRRVAIWILRGLIGVCTLFGIATATGLVWRSPAVHACLSKSLGRTYGCTYADIQDALIRADRRTALASQLQTRMRLLQREGNLERWSAPGGDYWIPAGEADELRFMIAERLDGEYGGLAIRPGDVALDVGAAVGTFTAAALAAGVGKVVAVEPDPLNVECLRRNFSREISAGRVVVYPKGFWDREDTLVLRGDPGHFGRGTFLGFPDRISVQARAALVPMDKAVAELGLERVDFIKMDIEGAESRALKGAAGTLRRFKPRMVIATYHLPDDPQTIPEVVTRLQPQYRSHIDHCVLCTRLEFRPEVVVFE